MKQKNTNVTQTKVDSEIQMVFTTPWQPSSLNAAKNTKIVPQHFWSQAPKKQHKIQKMSSTKNLASTTPQEPWLLLLSAGLCKEGTILRPTENLYPAPQVLGMDRWTKYHRPRHLWPLILRICHSGFGMVIGQQGRMKSAQSTMIIIRGLLI